MTCRTSLKEVICVNESGVPSLISWTFIIHAQKPWVFRPASRWGFDRLWRVLGADERLNPPPDLWKHTRCSFTPLSPRAAGSHEPASTTSEETRRGASNDNTDDREQWWAESQQNQKKNDKVIHFYSLYSDSFLDELKFIYNAKLLFFYL